jgi:predicted membrane chloride channel (bestrophin family)
MKLPVAVIINISFRVVVAAAYSLLGAYVAFWSDFNLGDFAGVPIVRLLGILFFIYGLFRLWRAYLYFKEMNEHEYGQYED